MTPDIAADPSNADPPRDQTAWWYRELFRRVPAALYVCDLAGRIVLFNQAAVELWGREPQLGEQWCGSQRIFRPDGTAMPLSDCPMAVALREKRPVTGEEIVIERPDGSRRSILPHPQPIYDDSGQMVGALSMLVDITDQKLAQEARFLLAAIVESSDDAIISKSLQGRIISWNAGARAIFGYTAEEAVGQPITLLIPNDRLAEEREIISRLSRGERIEHFETVRVTKDGRQIDISLSVSPVRDSSGRIIGASKIARDITARKRAEVEQKALRDALAEANRRKDEFLATLAHELRNPLAPLRNALSLLQHTTGRSEGIEEACGVMQRQLDHMTRLIEDLLDVSRISRGKLELRRQRVALKHVIDSAIETCTPLIEQRKHHLTVTLPGNAVFVDADPTRLSQSLANLLSNAAKYTPDGGHIWLLAQAQPPARVAISIRDTGVGIPAEMLDRVFDMFTQVDAALDRSQGGLGIGLTLVKRLIEMHGGTVEARSEGPGRGSEFLVHLPLAAEPPAAAIEPAEPAEQRATRPARPQRRVLVADDNRDAAETLARFLEIMGNQVQSARDGMEAVRIAEVFRPHVVCLDIGMPILNGYEAARRIREHPWGKEMILVALTGWGMDEDRQRSQQAGFDHHLVKPVEPDAIDRLLREGANGAGVSGARTNAPPPTDAPSGPSALPEAPEPSTP